MISNINQRKVRIKSVAEAYRIAKTHNTKIDEKQFFDSIGVGYIPVSTGESYVHPIVKYFKKRERK